MGSFNRDRGGGGSSFGRRDFGPRNFDRGGDRGGNRGGNRPMFKTTCISCGKDCEVPFRPTNGKPVYCSDCFEKVGGRRSDSPRLERSDFRAPSSDQNKAQFDAINVKLDRILNLLEPKVAPIVVPAPVVKEVEEVKAPKVKKEAKKTTPKKN
jgi:CxxC-x17-CxxC domain-containing protein